MMKVFGSTLAGTLLAFAFAPYSFYPMAVISLFLLLLFCYAATPKEALIRSLCYGIGYFGVGISWVYISIHDYGNSNILIGGLITLLFVLLLAIFPAIAAYITTKFYAPAKHSTYWLVFPAAWSLMEWVRSWIFTGFPWLLIGQSQTNSPLAGFAPIIGIYGVTFIVALSAGLLLTAYKHTQKGLSIILLLAIWTAGFGLTHIQWTKPMSQPLHVSLIQGNIPITMKWSPAYAENSLKIYEKLTEENWQPNTLVVWPETAVTILLDSAVPLLEDLDKRAHKKQSAIITGIPIPQGEDENIDYFNGAIVLGAGEGHYFKRHLVPFGEYTPFEKAIGKILNFLDLPMSNFEAGPQQQPLMHAFGLAIAPYICYEIAYSHLLRTDLPTANLLVTLSNDSWFGESFALTQHRQIAQFAALMTGRYMLVATNSGETVIIDPKGNLIGKSPLELAVALNGDVVGMQGATPWVTLGNTPFIILFLALLLFIRLRK